MLVVPVRTMRLTRLMHLVHHGCRRGHGRTGHLGRRHVLACLMRLVCCVLTRRSIGNTGRLMYLSGPARTTGLRFPFLEGRAHGYVSRAVPMTLGVRAPARRHTIDGRPGSMVGTRTLVGLRRALHLAGSCYAKGTGRLITRNRARDAVTTGRRTAGRGTAGLRSGLALLLGPGLRPGRLGLSGRGTLRYSSGLGATGVPGLLRGCQEPRGRSQTQGVGAVVRAHRWPRGRGRAGTGRRLGVLPEGPAGDRRPLPEGVHRCLSPGTAPAFGQPVQQSAEESPDLVIALCTALAGVLTVVVGHVRSPERSTAARRSRSGAGDGGGKGSTTRRVRVPKSPTTVPESACTCVGRALGAVRRERRKPDALPFHPS